MLTHLLPFPLSLIESNHNNWLRNNRRKERVSDGWAAIWRHSAGCRNSYSKALVTVGGRHSLLPPRAFHGHAKIVSCVAFAGGKGPKRGQEYDLVSKK